MTFEGKTVLVTGATGFLGGAVARRLAGDGAQVRALARRPGRDRYVRDVAGIEIVTGDITHADQLIKVTAGCDYVIHVAAATGGSLAAQQSVNVEGTRHIVEAAAVCNVERVVHVSTIAAYGYRHRDDVTEDTPLAPGSDPYSVTKAETEGVLRDVAAQRGISFSIIRPGMIYGPRSSAWTRGMFKLARRKPTIFIGDGSGSAYPIHVHDVVGLIALLALHPAADGQAFNATPDPSPTWREFLGAYAALAGHNRWLGIPPVVLRPAIALAGIMAPKDSRYRDLPDLLSFLCGYITFSMDKARRCLDWQPRISLEDGIQSCVPYLKEKGLLA
jgi:nucleoside-diphosphate-sugar epimerase